MKPTDRPIFLVSDIHGCINTLIRLLNRAPKGAQLVFNGDLIDRGPNSRAVVELAMEYAIPTVCGNHEDLALAFYNRKAHCARDYESGIWLHNGGYEALRNWPVDDTTAPYDNTPAARQELERDKNLGGRVPAAVLDWMEGLPPYLTPSSVSDENGRTLLVSHTGYGLNADSGHWLSALWGRHPLREGDFPEDNYWRTVGHTPVKEVAVTEKWGYIDTGCAYASRGFGHLSGLVWPTKEVLVEPFNEKRVKRQFTLDKGGIIG